MGMIFTTSDKEGRHSAAGIQKDPGTGKYFVLFVLNGKHTA